MGLDVTYKGSQIAQLTEDGNLTLETAGKYCEGDIELTYSGGGDIWDQEPPDDGKTRLYIELTPGRLSPILGLAVGGSVEIDWGDGSTSSILSGSQAYSTAVYTDPHTYPTAGKYIITISVVSGAFGLIGFNGEQQGTALLRYSASNNYLNRIYREAVKKIYIGSNYHIWGYSLMWMQGLEKIALTRNFAISANWRGYTNYVREFILPPGITSITSVYVSGLYRLTSLIIPATVTSIGASSFSGCNGVGEYHVKPTTPPTLDDQNAFNGISDDCIIYVPKGSLEDYKEATNWSVYASYMQEEPDDN